MNISRTGSTTNLSKNDRGPHCSSEERSTCLTSSLSLAESEYGITPEEYCHSLEVGDHVIRWTMLGFVYPIQVHGIVVSVGPDLVSIADFGYTSYQSVEGKSEVKDDELSAETEEMNQQLQGRNRLKITTLVNEKDIQSWKKVNYGNDELKPSKLAKLTSWWRKGEISNNEMISDSSHGKNGSITQGLENNDSEDVPSRLPLSEVSFPQKGESQEIQSVTTNRATLTRDKSSFRRWFRGQKTPSTKEKKSAPKLPNCDPTGIVLERVRYVLDNEPKLPPYHILHSNSECIAVWCKTGTWSTLQAAVFLSSAAFSQTKGTAALATFVSAQTVSIPATGWAGIWGGTTQVSLLSTQPWLIPAIAGYGICAIGAPFLILRSCKSKWERATIEMNDQFWSSVNPNVFIVAINSWAKLD